MAEPPRFRNAGCQGNFFRRGAPESALRKQAHRDAQNLQTPIFAGHPRAVCALRVNSFLWLQVEPNLSEVSAYLPLPGKRSQGGGRLDPRVSTICVSKWDKDATS